MDKRWKLSSAEKRFILLSIIIIGFLISKLLFWCFNTYYLYSYDEVQKMRLAEAVFVEKLPFSYIISNIFDYQYESYLGGSLVSTVLYIPIAGLLGISTFSYKLIALLFAVGTVFMWFIFIRKFFNTNSALLTGILFVFAPPVYNTFALITWGAHMESAFFVILGLFVICSVFDSGGTLPKVNGILFFILGLISGFSLYFVNSYIIAIVAFLALWLITGRRSCVKKNFLFFSIGFIVGFSPWILARIMGGKDMTTRGYPIAELFHAISPNTFHGIKSSLLNIPILPPSYKNDFVFSSFPLWLQYATRYLFRAVFVSSFFYLALKIFKEKRMHAPLVGIVLYISVFILAYTMASHNFNYHRHSVPMYPFVFAVIGITFGTLLERKTNAIVRSALLILFTLTVLVSILDNFNLVSAAKFRNPVDFKGYEYAYKLKSHLVTQELEEYFDRYINYKKQRNQAITPIANYFPYHYQELFQQKYGGRAGLHWVEDALSFVRSHIIEILNEQLAEEQIDIENWGWSIGMIYGWDIKKCVETISQLNLPDILSVVSIYHNLGVGISNLDEDKMKNILGAVSALDADIQKPILRGVAGS